MIANPVEVGKHDPYFMSLNVTFETKMMHPAINKEVPTAKQEGKVYI